MTKNKEEFYKKFAHEIAPETLWLNGIQPEDVWDWIEEYKEQEVEKAQEQPLQQSKCNMRCGICGGKMVYIRGKYPDEKKRKICPTCTYERLE